MGEKDTQQTPKFNLNFIGLGDTTKRLDDYQDEIVTVEVCCCNFLKKVTGCMSLIGRDFIEITGPNTSPFNGFVDIKIYCPEPCGEYINESGTATQVLIPRDRICAIECLTCCDEPCGPCSGGSGQSEVPEEE